MSATWPPPRLSLPTCRPRSLQRLMQAPISAQAGAADVEFFVALLDDPSLHVLTCPVSFFGQVHIARFLVKFQYIDYNCNQFLLADFQ